MVDCALPENQYGLFLYLMLDWAALAGRPLRMRLFHLSGSHRVCYSPACFLIISSIFFFTASRLKLAGSCIGG